MAYKDKSANQQKIAQERIVKLFEEAESNFASYPQLSKRYILLARRLSTRYKVRLTGEQKKKFCKSCNAYLKVGSNSRIRLEHGKLAQTCLECNAVRRTIYK